MKAPGTTPKRAGWLAAGQRAMGLQLLVHPVLVLLAVVVSAAIALRALFFWQAEWLWHFARVVSDADITPWAREDMIDRDGAEPYALMALLLVLFIVTASGYAGLSRLRPRWRALAVASLLALVVGFAYQVPLRPPLPAVAPLPARLLVVTGGLLATLLLQRSMRFRRGVLVALAVVLLPICFLRSEFPDYLENLCSIVGPALRLQHGFGLRQVYLQYDLLPSLLALGWNEVGGAPLGFVSVVAVGYYAMFLGLFVLARRLFGRASLAAPLLVSVALVRVYGIWGDASATPQVTPIRLELWLLLLGAALGFGLEHWLVGLVLGLLCLFSRSMGTLYLGAYALALLVDFLARRFAAPAASRPGWWQDLGQSSWRLAPAVACVVAFLGVARWLFGGFGSDALALYRELGVGMLRIAPESFYWWLLPVTGGVGWLAFSRRGSLPDRRGQAAIFALALIVINSLYFFGRSHEHNLINLSTSFLFCLFLGLDLAWPSLPGDPRPLVWAFRLAPWWVVGTCAYFYSDRIVHKLGGQAALIADHQPLILGVGTDLIPVAQCNEIRTAAGDSRLFFFAENDFFFYHDCGFEPQGYVHPVALNVLKEPLLLELNQLLAAGYKIVVPRAHQDWHLDWHLFFDEFRRDLSETDVVETLNYSVYRQTPLAAGPASP